MDSTLVLANPFLNSLQHRLRLIQHFIIPKAKEPHSETFQPPLPPVIQLFDENVPTAINLDGEHQFPAEEIDDVLVDRALAVKVATADLGALEVAPKSFLRTCRLFP